MTTPNQDIVCADKVHQTVTTVAFINLLNYYFMSKSKENLLTKTYGGKLGNQLVLRTRGDVSILAKRPKKSSNPITSKVAKVRRNFKLASIWAKNALLDPAVRADYMARIKGNESAYNLAMRNFLKPPVVDTIDASGYHGQKGERIKVVALDDFKVTGLDVKITGPNGTLIEEGSCQEDAENLCWIYTATVDAGDPQGFVVHATALDIPGHPGSLEVTL
jgi:hypothetical protein